MFYLEALLIKKHLRVKWCKLSLVQCSIQLCELKKKVVPCAQTDRHDEENKKKVQVIAGLCGIETIQGKSESLFK